MDNPLPHSVFDHIWRLHPRGPANRGICVDAEGAVLGPDCVLVGRMAQGFRALERENASTLQKCLLSEDQEPDWLFRQCQRIADSLDKGEIALAQIYGLRIPIGNLDERQLKRIVLVELAKAGFNPDEPRVPKSDPHGGEWTTGGDGGSVGSPVDATAPDADSEETSGEEADAGGSAIPATLAFLDTLSTDATTIGDGAEAGAQEVASRPATNGAPAPAGMQYQFVAPRTGAGLVGDESQWLWNNLEPATEAALRQLLIRLTGATIVFGILFIPTNRSPITEGPIANSADLSYRYDSDTGVLQIRQAIRSLGPVVLTEAHLGADGVFRDAAGVAIGHYMSGSGAAIDTDSLSWPRAANDNALGVVARNDNQPKLCPDPSPDNPGAPLDNPYQRYVSMLVNGRALPPGVAVSLFNPASGSDVVFDDCRLSDGTMIEAKGDGYLEMLLKGPDRMPWLGVQAKLLKQANAQLQAAQGRPVEWYFKAQPVADFVRALFRDQALRITVIYAPQPE
jgi:hypothetical protein